MDIQADIELASSVLALLVQGGKTIAEMAPEVIMFFQILSGKKLSDEQRSDLMARHQELSDAALAPLGDDPEGE